MPRLPDKPSELIRLALADLEKVERDPRYKINMGSWHNVIESPSTGRPVCAVCLAGAVMAGALEESVHRSVRPWEYDRDTEHKLYALDMFRTGNVDSGFRCLMGLYTPGAKALIRGAGQALQHSLRHMSGNGGMWLVRYETDTTAFKRDLRGLADLMESKGV